MKNLSVYPLTFFGYTESETILSVLPLGPLKAVRKYQAIKELENQFAKYINLATLGASAHLVSTQLFAGEFA